MNAAPTYESLSAALAARAAQNTSAPALTFIEAEGREYTLTANELQSRALGVLHHLQAAGAVPGSETILLLEGNRPFIDAFWACMLGGVIAVPLAPGNADEHRAKFFRVMDRLRNPGLCTDARTYARIEAYAETHNLKPALERLRGRTLLLDQVSDVSQPGKPHAAQAEDIAFVQYSSGSTSQPKGVALTHANLLANIRAIAHGIALREGDAGLSWMPLTHDMGLIGFHLTPLVMGIPHSLMPTALFVRRPQLWLSQAADKRASILCSPNFGYKHFLKNADVAQAAALDLSAVRILFNGAEPVTVSLCEEFLAALAPARLDARAMFPVYGLAEASLAVSFPRPGERYATASVDRNRLAPGLPVVPLPASDPRAATLVCAGWAVEGCELKIADNAGTSLPDGSVGHILIRGANVTRGYYRDEETTRAVMRGDGWLDTGDLGFMGEHGLVITGRYKDIIFSGGQNYYPQDIEAALDSHAGIELGRAAAVGVRLAGRDADEIVVFVVHKGDAAAFLPVARDVVRNIAEVIGVTVARVVPVTRLPKTTSGKVQRYLLAEQYAQGEYAAALAELDALSAPVSGGESAAGARGDIERQLKDICDATMPGVTVGVNDNIFELGTSSLTLAQIHQRIEALYPGKLEVTDFFDYPTIAELAGYLEGKLKLS